MPSIKPFRGIHPSPGFVEKVALQVESLSLDQAKRIRQDNPFSYINMLVPKVNPLFGRASKQELAFKVINENLEEFLDKGILVQDEEAALYIYQVRHNGFIQNGIWAVTAIDDYLENRVKRHELTREERERALVEYLRQTGIDANPVLITYRPDAVIDQAVNATVGGEPLLTFGDGEKEYAMWKITDTDVIQMLVDRCENLPATYIADGHHRAAAACSYGLARRKSNANHRGDEAYNYFTSVYIPADQLKIVAFNRLVKSDEPGEELLNTIGRYFDVEKSSANAAVIPAEPGTFGLYFRSTWHRLRPRDPVNVDNPVAALDVSVLQDKLLSPIFHITDPRTDPRLNVAGGATPVSHLTELVDKGEYTLAFTLFPTTIDQLFSVADAGEVMPPKSTWFEPKFQAGLLIHYIE